MFVYVLAEGCDAPSSPDLFMDVAREARAVPCYMPVRRQGDGFVRREGWGLIHAETGQPYDPAASVSDALIEVSDWELHDMALQIVRNQLESEGAQILSWQPSMHIDPSLWFRRDGAAYWVVVRAFRPAADSAPRPGNLKKLAARLAQHAATGYFAQVRLAAVDAEEEVATAGPIYRGHPLAAVYDGLEPV